MIHWLRKRADNLELVLNESMSKGREPSVIAQAIMQIGYAVQRLDDGYQNLGIVKTAREVYHEQRKKYEGKTPDTQEQRSQANP